MSEEVIAEQASAPTGKQWGDTIDEAPKQRVYSQSLSITAVFSEIDVPL